METDSYQMEKSLQRENRKGPNRENKRRGGKGESARITFREVGPGSSEPWKHLIKKKSQKRRRGSLWSLSFQLGGSGREKLRDNWQKA